MAFRWAVALVVLVVSTEVVVECCWSWPAPSTQENEEKGPCTLKTEEINEMLSGPDYVLDLTPPDCDADGYYSPKQCDLFQGYCRCVDKEGNQIGDYNGFVTDVQMGQEGTWDDSTCACAREADDITSQTPRPGMFVPRCDWKGDYDNIQCRGSMCYCVDDNLQQVGQSVNRWEEHLLNCDGSPPTLRPLPPTFRPRPPTFPTLPPRGCLYGGQFYPPDSTIYETTGCMGSGARCDENGQVLVWDNFGFGCCERNGQYYEDGTTITEGDLTCTCVGSDGAMPAPMACTGPPTAEPIGPIPPTLPPTYLFGICDDNSCFNSGVCEQVSFGSYYTCTCPPGTSGTRCETSG